MRVPASAPAGPPETAQSKKITSCDFKTEAILCDSPGSPEVVSTQYLTFTKVPCCFINVSTISRTLFDFGRQLNTTSEFFTADSSSE